MHEKKQEHGKNSKGKLVLQVGAVLYLGCFPVSIIDYTPAELEEAMHFYQSEIAPPSHYNYDWTPELGFVQNLSSAFPSLIAVLIINDE